MTIEHQVVQGSPAWFKLRQGRPTASSFEKIITPKTAQISKSSRKYAYQLLAERLLNQPTENNFRSDWTERGKELEPSAARQYGFMREVELREAGFFTTDDGLIGASPDRIVIGEPVGLEIKCCTPANHIGYLLDGTDENYKVQTQGQLLVCEFELVDLYCYSDRMPACTIRTARDEPYIALLSSALKSFNEQMAEMEERAKALGLFQAYEEAETDAVAEIDGELRAELAAE